MRIKFNMKSCGMSLIKYILFVFNFIFAISGLGILIAGALVLADVNEFNHFLEGRVAAPPIVLIVTGAIIFLIASLGCWGAIKENAKLLYVFAVLLGIIFIIELAVGIAACVFKADLEKAIKSSLQESIARSSNDDLIAWDNTQRKLECCGVDRPSDWIDFSKNQTLRSSCCRPEVIDAATKDCKYATPLFKDKYFQDGCVMKLRQRMDSNATVLIGVGIGIAFIQLVGILLACWLASSIRSEQAK